MNEIKLKNMKKFLHIFSFFFGSFYIGEIVFFIGFLLTIISGIILIFKIIPTERLMVVTWILLCIINYYEHRSFLFDMKKQNPTHRLIKVDLICGLINIVLFFLFIFYLLSRI